MRSRRKPFTEQERRDLVVREGELSALAQHPSWPVFEAVLQERVQVYANEITAHVFNGEPLSVERQHYIRGFIKGMYYALAVPVGAEASLARYLREHQPQEFEEVESGLS